MIELSISINIAELLMEFAFFLSLANTIVCAFPTQAWIVLIAQFKVTKEEKTIIAVFPMEFDMDLSIVTNKVFVNSINM